MSKKILIVDDEPDNITTVKQILEKNGYETITASNGDEGLVVANKEKPDLVLLDIMMPGTSVKEIVPKLKSKVVYLSVVRVSEAEREHMLNEKNVVGFIQKPFDINELLIKIKEITGK